MAGSAAGMQAAAAGTAPAQQAADQRSSTAQLKISINLAARSLALYRDTDKIRLYPIGPGAADTPTPVGYYKIQEKDVNPTWTDPDTGVSIPSGPDNPLGYRWMTLKGNIGIHGTNRPDSVGHLVSHGCIRMREKDVEALFDLVHVGTPVEITYNRVVVEKAPDDTVVYYVYPDGYGWQKLRPEDVQKWLSGYGVGDFVSDSDIEAKIDASDGEPTFVAKVYPLYLNGIRLKKQAVVQDGITYLPANDLAEASGIDLGWNPESGMLISTLGKAKGYDKRDVLYCRAEDAAVLFHLDGVIDENKRFVLTAKKQKEMMDTAAEEKAKTAEHGSDPYAAGVTEAASAEQQKPADGSASRKTLDQIYQEATK
ncbi:MAG: L,D-transpeptidase family protein [Selenomonas montiformis]|nr:L,D-transpeptidase family protein [Selenomonas montiformis]